VSNNKAFVQRSHLEETFSELADIAGAFSKHITWSRSYFAGTCGGAPLETIKAYIDNQDRPV
jgi:REP element-mobilizing transposase RayT